MTNTKKAKTQVETTPEAMAKPAKAEAVAIIDTNDLYKTQKEVLQAIDQAVLTGNKLQVEYQRILVSALKQLDIHKDIRAIRHIYDTAPKSLRRDSMATFIHKVGAVTVDDKGQFHYDKTRKLNLVQATHLAWWKAKAETVYVPVDFVAKLEHVWRQGKKRLQAGVHPDKGDNITPEQVDAIEALLNQWSQAQVA